MELAATKTIRLSEDVSNALDAVASRWHISRSAVVKILIMYAEDEQLDLNIATNTSKEG